MQQEAIPEVAVADDPPPQGDSPATNPSPQPAVCAGR